MTTKKKRSLLNKVANIFAVCCIVFLVGIVALVMTATVSGTATLPNGTVAQINGPFSCSANGTSTEIEAGGHTFAFTPTTISIDAVSVGPLDETITKVQIDATSWTASLKINGSEVTKRR